MANAWQMEQDESLKALENFSAESHLRQQGIYVWAFPITYPDKQTFGWEYELPDGRTSWYSEELPTYNDAMAEGVRQATAFSKPRIVQDDAVSDTTAANSKADADQQTSSKEPVPTPIYDMKVISEEMSRPAAPTENWEKEFDEFCSHRPGSTELKVMHVEGVKNWIKSHVPKHTDLSSLVDKVKAENPYASSPSATELWNAALDKLKEEHLK